MLHFFEEFGFYAEITGFKSVTFEQADTYLKANRKGEQKVWIQFFNSDLIATQEHLYFAILNALTAFKKQTNLSKSIAMETMLYASSQRQIQKAIQVIGIKPDMSQMAVTVIGESAEQVTVALKELSSYLHAQPSEAVLELTPKKVQQIQQAFNITAPMVEVATKNRTADLALIDLVIEQVALLATQL
ncbi:MAG: KEOPS complex subunit Cgi121 [Candidatus Bathyarchaeia archaeon]|jgi:tRNA threonylcarbamoyladenosine modification (KEOPS) complex Cgi121 subunit